MLEGKNQKIPASEFNSMRPVILALRESKHAIPNTLIFDFKLRRKKFSRPPAVQNISLAHYETPHQSDDT
jgi:hypothetical protein